MNTAPRGRTAQKLLTLLVLLAAIPLTANRVFGAWGSSGNDVTSDLMVYDQPGHDPAFTVGTSVCTDGDGGLICAVKSGTLLGPTWELRIQRLNSTGTKAWLPSDGFSLSGAATSTGPPHVVSDRAGGAWVVWADSRATGAGPGLYVQRVNHDGSLALAAYPMGKRIVGVEFSAGGSDDVDVDVAPDGMLLVAYQSWLGVRVNRIRLDGTADISAVGALVSTDTGSPRLDLVADGSGFVIVWESVRAGLAGANSVIANRLTSAGTALWGTEGVVLYSAAGVTPTITHGAWDGANLFASWRQGNHVRAQKVDAGGVVQWGGGGVAVLTAPNTAWDISGNPVPQIASDAAGGCIIVWQDYRDYDRGTTPYFHREDIYGQRLDATGANLWTANGAPLDTLLGRHFFPAVLPDGAGGVFVAFTDLWDVDLDITLKRITAAGATSWVRHVTGTSGDNGTQDYVCMAHDDASGVLLAWWDARNGSIDCFGSHVDAGGSGFSANFTLTAPNGGESYVSPQVAPVTWTTNLGGNVKLEYAVGGGARSLIVASTPNDGSYDWAVPAINSSAVRVFVSDAADGAPVDASNADFSICAGYALPAPASYAAGTTPIEIVSGDFDEDGIEDIAVVDGAPASTVSVLLGNGAAGVGDGTFGAATAFPVGASPQSLARGDFNEDGILDLAVGVTLGVRILLGTGAGGVGDGAFGAPSATYAIAGAIPVGIAAADFNEDGIVDLATGNSSANSVSMLLGNGTGGVGDGTFAPAVTYAAGTNVGHLAVADLDGDGILDLAVCQEVATPSSVQIVRGGGAAGVGNGTLAPTYGFSVGALPRAVATGDFNADGRVDLAIANRNSNNVTVLLGAPPGVSGLDPNFTVLGPFATGNGPSAVAVGDFTGDGIVDLAVACASSADRVDLLEGNGTGGAWGGAFAMVGSYATGNEPRGIVRGDFDENGTPDFATSNVFGNDVTALRGGCAAAGQSLAVASANGGEVWPVGVDRPIVWSRSAGIHGVHLEISHDGGATWQRLASDLTGTSHLWRVTAPTTTTALLRVIDAAVPTRQDQSDAVFTIVDDGVTSVPETRPRAASFAGPWPNPGAGAVNFALTLPAAQAARVRIVDVAGRTVRSLAQGELAAGEHALVWDGRDSAGTPVRPGMYFAAASGPGFEFRKIVARVR